MSIPDLINGAFELTGGVICWLNVRRLLRDKQIAGVDWRVSGFFSAWGLWNLFYYPSPSQWASFAGGVALVIANTTWVVLALRTIREQSRASLREAEEAMDWRVHWNHKAFEPSCKFCQTALALLPEIAHPLKCECDICKDL